MLDASLTLAFLFADERTDAIAAVLDRAAVEPVIAPAIWPLEVQNGLLVAERRKRITAVQVDGFLANIEALGVTIDPAPPSTGVSLELQFARKHLISVYDASYLATAYRRSIPLASSDSALIRAARQAGIDVISP